MGDNFDIGNEILLDDDAIDHHPELEYPELENSEFDAIGGQNNTGAVVHWNDTKVHPTPPTMFACAGIKHNMSLLLQQTVFEEYQIEDLSNIPTSANVKTWNNILRQKPSNEYDIFMYDYNMGSAMSCSSIVTSWLLTKFQGHFIAFSCESPSNHPFTPSRNNMHFVGPAEQPTENDIVTYFFQYYWLGQQRDSDRSDMNQKNNYLKPHAMVDSNFRPRGSKEYFIIYLQGNCVYYREQAAARISEIGPVHCAGKCQGRSPPSGDRSNLTSISAPDRGKFRGNAGVLSNYRFCLVMENKKQSGYITEKIMNAFAAGCIPVYYGTEEIFAIFNKRSFVYYNVSDPQPALDEIKRLENDEDAYEKMLTTEPIVANGNLTIEQYFSFEDNVMNGVLKRRYRQLIGLSDLYFVP